MTGASLAFNRPDTSYVYADVISGAGGVKILGGGTVTFTNANLYTGATSILNGAKLVVADGSGGFDGFIASGAVVLGDGSSTGTLVFDRTGTVTFSGNITGTAGALEHAGAGTLVLSGAGNTFAGGSSITGGGTLQIGDGTTGSIAGDIDTGVGVNAGRVVFALGSASFTYGGTPPGHVISGEGSLEKTGSGMVILLGLNTYSGGTTVTGGTLQIGNGSGSFPSGIIGDVSVASGATLDLRNTLVSTMTLGDVTGLGTFTKSQSGTVVILGILSAATKTITGGTVQIGDGTTAGSLLGNVTNNATLVFNLPTAPSVYDYTGEISGSGAVRIQGGRVVQFTGANSYSGGTVLAGTLIIGEGGSIVGPVATNIGAISGTLAFDNSATSTFAGVISGPGSLEQRGTGTLTLTGANSYTGGTFIESGGTLQFGDGSVDGVDLAAVGALGDIVNQGVVIFNQPGSFTIAGGISGAGVLVKDGGGTLTLSNGNSAAAWSTRILDGRLVLSGAGSIGAGSITFDGGTLEKPSAAGSFALSQAILLEAGGGTIDTVGDLSLLGAVSGAGGLTKAGSGGLSLSNAGSMTGDIAVTGGTLTAAASSTLGTGAVTLSANTTLAVGGTTRTIANTITLAGDATIATVAPATLSGAVTTFAGNITESGGARNLVVSGWTNDGGNTIVLSGSNSYSGTTTLSSGTLSIAGDGNIGAGALSLGAGTTLAVTAAGTIDNAVGLTGNATLDNAADVTLSGVLSGAATLTKTGAGTLTLSNAGNKAAMSGGITVTAGTLSIAATNVLSAGILTLDGGALAVSVATTIGEAIVLGASGGSISNGGVATLSGVISGAGALTKIGAGILVLSGDNTYGGGTTISAGTLQVGAGGATGSIQGAVANSGTLIFNRAAGSDLALTDAVTGTGDLVKRGGNILTLSGVNSAGAVTVESGMLEIGAGVGLTSATVTVQSGGTLKGITSGTGTASIAGAVIIADGGHLLAVPSSGGYGLSMTSLTLSGSSNLDVDLGVLNTAVFQAGTLTLDGVLNITDTGGMALGVYRIIDYTTRIGTGDLEIGTAPSTFDFSVQVTASQVNLIVGGGLRFWNGETLTGGMPVGGNGTWSVGPTNWTTAGGAASDWGGYVAVFSGAAGIVTVDGTGGPISTTGMQFAVDGYSVQGAPITLASAAGQTVIRVGDGTTQGASYVATISASLDGTTGLNKTDLGTLILSGTNTYTGGTTVSAGTLQLSGLLATEGTILGDILVQSGATLAFARQSAITVSSSISGAGDVVQKGPGTITLNGTNTYSGATTIESGIINASGGSAIGDTSAVLVAGTFGVLNSEVIGSLAGTGAVRLASGQILTTGGNNADTTFSGRLVQSGGLTKVGTGTMTMTGANTYTGATVVDGGRLAIGGGASLSDSSGLTIASGASLELLSADETVGSLTGAGEALLNGYRLIAGGDNSSTSYSGIMSGTGGLTKTGTGTMTVTGANSFTGGTDITGGTLAIGGGTSLSDTASLTIAAGAALILTDGDETVGSLAGAGDVTLNGFRLIAGGDNSSTIYSGTLDGTGGLTKTGTGTLTLDGTNTYSGATNITAGTVQVSDAAALGSGALALEGSGTLRASATFGSGAAISLTASGTGGGTFQVDGGMILTLTGLISGTGSLSKTGTGELVIGSGTPNSYGGATNVDAGTLRAIGGNAIGDTSIVTVTAGAALILDAAETIGVLAGSGAVTLNGTLTTGGTHADSTYAGAMDGAGGLTKTGTGTMTLTGTNAYSGATIVDGGRLAIGGGSSLSDTAGLTIAAGASLELLDSNETVGALAGAGGVTLNSHQLFVGGDNSSSVYSGIMSGTGGLTKTGTGTMTMTGTNTFTGATGITGGTLAIGGGASLSDTSALSIAAGAALVLTDADETVGSLAGAGHVALNGFRLTVGGDNSSTAFSGALDGAGGLTKTGTGTLTLEGTNSFSGGAAITGGTVQASSAAALGSGGLSLEGAGTLQASGNIAYGGTISLTPSGGAGGGTFQVDGSRTLELTGAISGTGGLDKTGAGTLILGGGGANTYGGATNINTGTLIATGGDAIGNTSAVTVAFGAMFVVAGNETVGSLAGTGQVTLNANLTSGGAADTVFDGNMTGSGGLTKTGTGTLTLTGTNTFTGTTAVSAGGLDVAGRLSGDVTVANLATLGGSGSIAGTVNVQTGGTLTGAQPAGLSMGGLNLAAGSSLNVTLDAPSQTAVFNVTGDLTLGGTMNVTGVGGFGAGVYRIFSYGGTLTDNGIALGTFPAGYEGGLQTSVANQVNLFVESPPYSTGFWNGAFTTPQQTVAGGSGTWSAGPLTNWTNASGTISRAWSSGFTVFQGTAGTVTVSDDAGVIAVTGMQFFVDGYQVEGDSIALGAIGAPTTIRVGDGTADGAGYKAMIAAQLTGTSGMEKSDLGTLILTGTNSYGGGTVIAAGTLQLGNGGTSGSIVGDVANHGVLSFNRSDATTFSGAISGDGAVLQTGTGTTILVGTNTYTGGTIIAAGTLQIGDAGTAGSLVGDVLTIGTLAFNRSDELVFAGTISGSGTLAQIGTGTLILTGDNTYTGGTIIASGTLQVGNGDVGGSITGNVTNNGTLVFNNSDDVSFDGSVSGGGALIHAGSRTLTLTGDNVSLGLTTIVSGTLRLGNGGTSGSLDGDVLNNGALVFNRADQLDFHGAIAGSGLVTQTGTGVITLSGLNSYAGGTQILAGTLQVASDIALGAAAGGLAISDATFGAIASFSTSRAITLAGSAGIAVAANETLTLSGVLGGAGMLIAAGPGTLELNGANTYAGGTSIQAGRLKVGADTALGATPAGLALNGGTLAASASFASAREVTLGASGGTFEITGAADTLTLSGVISGQGGLTKTGDGVLVLLGENIYGGVTTINAGTLQLGNGGASGTIMGNVVNNATLAFNRSDSYTFPGTISGAGNVTFEGGGTVLFTAPGGFTGAVTVDQTVVELQQASTTTSNFAINAGGILGGTATIGGLTVNTGGTAAPGYSPGTLTVNGAVAFNAGALYQVDVTTAGAHDLIIATGTATLSSSAHVEVLAEYGRYPALSQITILTAAGGVSGQFSEDVTSNFAFLTPELTYDATNVYLTLTYTGIDFVEYAQTPNQANVAVAAQALGAASPVFEAIFGLAANEVPAAFNQLTGEIYPSINTVIQQESTYLRDAVGARLRQSVTPQGASALSYAAQAAGPANTKLSQDLTPTLWMQGYGGWGNAFGNTNAASISSTVGGFFAGLDVSVLDNVRAGVVAGFSQTQFDVDARNSSGTMDNYDIGFYAGGQFGAFALRGGASYTWHDISVSRSIVFPGFSGSTSAGYTLGTTQVFGEVGYDFNIGAYAFEPFAGLAYLNISGGNLAESGLASNGAGLNVSTDSQNTLYTTLGLRAATSLSLGGRTLTPSATLGWQHAFGDTTPTATMLFQSGATPFAISGVPIAQNTLLLGAGLAYALSDLATLQVNYTGQLAGDASQNAFTAQFSLKF